MKRKKLKRFNSSSQKKIKKNKKNVPQAETSNLSLPESPPTPASPTTTLPASPTPPPPPPNLKRTYVDHWAHTQSELYNISYTWTIDNFSFRQEKNTECLESPKFYVDLHDEIKWGLELYPRGEHDESKDYVSVFLKLLSEPCNKSRVLVKFKIYLLNVEPNKTISSYSSKADQFMVYKCWGYTKLIERAILLNESNGFLPDDKLTVFCEVSFVYDSIDISSQSSIGQFKVPEYKVTDDLADLLDSREFSDVTLVVDENEFPAHKAILAARSDVFAAMFQHEMQESKSGRVTIVDVNREVLQELLYFIYTGETSKIKEMAHQLLAAADKYALKQLKVMCEKEIFAELSIETAVETLILANFHNAKQLKEQTMHFINIHINDIIQTKGWKDLIKANDHSALIAELLEAFIIPMKQHLPIPSFC